MLEVGQRWTFVHGSGERSQYEIVSIIPGGDNYRPIPQLRNLATGGLAQVTEAWLVGQLSVASGAHWELAE